MATGQTVEVLKFYIWGGEGGVVWSLDEVMNPAEKEGRKEGESEGNRSLGLWMGWGVQCPLFRKQPPPYSASQAQGQSDTARG